MADPTPKFAPSASGLLREQLEFVGWTEGDAIPPDLPDRLAELKSEAISELEAAIADTPSTALSAQLRQLTGSQFAKITDFPPAQQLAAREYVQGWIEKGEMDAELAAREAELDAKLPSQLTGEARSRIRQSIQDAQSPLFVIEDDTQDEASKPDESATGVAEAPQFCPCCNWDLAKRTLEVMPTNSDKQMFLMTMLGDSRFFKTYHVLNKQFTIVFRELTHDETQLIYDELAFAMRRGMAMDNLGYFSAFQDARFLLALTELRAGGRLLAKFPPVHEWLKEDPGYVASTKTGSPPEAGSLLSGPTAWLNWLTGKTKVKAVVAEASETVPAELEIETPMQRYFAHVNAHIPNTTLRHILRKKEREFFMLTELLAERIDDENFYAGIVISG